MEETAILNKDGKTPLDLATSNKGKCGSQIVELLEEHLKIYEPPNMKKAKLDCNLIITKYNIR